MTPQRSLVLVLDNIRSMHNVGSIFRTADAFGISAIYLCGFTPKPPHRDINKTALGATESVPWRWFSQPGEAITALAADHYQVIAIEQTPESISLDDFQVTQDRTAMVLGNEVDGVSREALNLASACIYVPQLGMKKSLNVSVCAGIVCWHVHSLLLNESRGSG